MSRYTNVDCSVEGCNQYHKPNLPLLRKIVDQIVEKPSSWNQATWGTVVFDERVADATGALLNEVEQRWDCQTAFCVAGHAAVFSGWEPVLAYPMSAYTLEEHPLGENIDHRKQGLYRGASGVYSCTSAQRGDEAHAIAEVAKHELGLTYYEASRLFSGANTLDDVLKVCHRIAKRGHERWS